ncbi:hypothetical protein L3X38_024422 [Prunus dulcis]|uniref:CCHC-type domain-containing protein n=1 Tax=Prunus dulcis TaxID=3755 RepID=A0AAD4VZS6_PRUDU|nr:hypothetical protein L3X38_024422 [Prunus dulcis]
MAQHSTEELTIQLEESLGISSLENGPKLIGADEDMARKILERGPWSVMRHCFSVRRWPLELAVEEIDTHLVPFWVQVRGIPLNLCTEENAVKIGRKIGDLVEYENPNQARGFLRLRVEIDTAQPLPAGFWLPRSDGSETWAELQYERLSDFCYNCGRLGHCNTECPQERAEEGAAGYGTWTRARVIRELYEQPKPISAPQGERRAATTPNKRHTNERGRRVHHAREIREDIVSESREQTCEMTSQLRTHDSRFHPLLTDGTYVVTQAAGDTTNQLVLSRSVNPSRHTFMTGKNPGETTQILGKAAERSFNNTVTLEEINLSSEFIRPAGRKGPISEEERMELLKAQNTKAASFITDWTRPGPSHREDRFDDGPLGSDLQLEPVLSNPFGPQLKQNSPMLVGQINNMFTSMGLKRVAETEVVGNFKSPDKKAKGSQNEESLGSTKGKTIKAYGRTNRRRGQALGSNLFSEERLQEVKVTETEDWGRV